MREASPWAGALLVVACMLSAVAALWWLKFGLQVWQAAREEPEPVSWSGEPVPVDIGGQTLMIPANMILGDGGGEDPVRLQFVWPSLEGVTKENRALFADHGAGSPVIHVTLRAAGAGIPAGEKFKRIMAPQLRGREAGAPEGLIGRAFATGSGYGGDTLYHSTDNGSGVPEFMIRCGGSAGHAVPTDCLRSIQAGDGLQMDYRYRRPLLEDWRAIDGAVISLIEGFERKNAGPAGQ